MSAVHINLSDGAAKDEWLFPVEGGVISSVFGERTSPIFGSEEVHNGVDIAVPEGTAVKAVADGKIVTAGISDSYGNYIVEEITPEYSALYAHLSKHEISEGAEVKKGDEIALSGHTGWATGPHLHLTVKKNGEDIDPMTMYPK